MNKRNLAKMLFVLGLLLIITPYVLKKINTYRQGQKVESFQTEIKGNDVVEIDKELERFKKCYYTTYYDEGIHDPFEESNQKLKDFLACIGEDREEVFAAIEIPKLGLKIPIYLGSTETELSKGIGHVEGSSLPLGGVSTHTILSGHRGMGTKEMFRNINQLYEDDLFYIHGKTGTLKYKVTQQRVIYPDETSSLGIEEGKDKVTLLTCHPYRYNYQRLLIHAERVN